MDGCARPGASPISLVIPALNEAPNIEQAIEEANSALSARGVDYEILVVDDGSHDATVPVALAAAARSGRVRVLQHCTNQGYGAALRTGFEAARFDLIAFTDGDCQFDLRDLNRLAELTQRVPVAVGYRIERQDGWFRRIYSRGYNLLVQALLGTRVRDCDCALKVFQRATLRRLLPESRDFFVNAEMLTRARLLGYGIAECGVHHRPRSGGRSKVSLLDAPRVLRTLLPFWWTHVLFPARQTSKAGTARWIADPGLWTILLVGICLLFARIRCPLLEPEEARYAEIPRQMLATGHWIVPVLHGQPYCQKPPLLYWLIMASYGLFGVHDWAARLVPCSAALGGILLAYGWGRKVVGARAAFIGALILSLSARYIYMARMLSMDSLLCFWVVAAWTAAHAAVQGRVLRWSWWLLSAAACGLGLLTKGPVTLVLFAIPVVIIACIDRRTTRPGRSGWLLFAATSLAVALPWYLALGMREPDLLRDFVWSHNILRFVRPVDHAEPVWYYVPELLGGMMPWSLCLPLLISFLARRQPRTAARRPAALGFFLLSALGCLGFFSLSGCKRPAYILPAMPPLALALGVCLDAILPRRLLRAAHVASAGHRRLAHGATMLVLLAGVIGAVSAMTKGLAQPAWAVAVAACSGLGLLYLREHGPIRRIGISWGFCGIATFVLLLAGVHHVLPMYAREFSLRAQVRPQKDLCVAPGVAVACFPHRWDSISFYLNRNDVRAYSADRLGQLIADLRAGSTTLVFVKTGASTAKLITRLPATLEFIPRGQNGIITAGIVQPRARLPETLFAARQPSEF